jgi:hypothetical protein
VRAFRNESGRQCLSSKQTPPKLHHIARRVSRFAAGAFTATLSLSSAGCAKQSELQLCARRVRRYSTRPCLQQRYGCSLSGIISDPNGAVVSGADGDADRPKGGSFFTFTTGDDGAYKFSLLPAGSYSLTAEASSFTSSRPRQSNSLMARIEQ